jgi:hypothetical protein
MKNSNQSLLMKFLDPATSEAPTPGISSQNHEDLGQIRDTSPASSRNTSKGALVKETYAVFSTVHAGLPLSDVRQAILNAEVFQKTSYETRRKIWNALHHRYLLVCAEWIGQALAAATQEGRQSPEYLSLIYLYFALRDHLTFDFVTGPVWEKWTQKIIVLEQSDFLLFLEQQAERFPQIKKWRESTRHRLASANLTALRDFGVLKGVKKKRIQRPLIAAETVFHLLSLLRAEGLEGRALIEAPDWRLFLWSEADIASALAELAQKGWIRFEKAGRTVLLEILRGAEGNP